jgi:hypothetical protein
VVPAQEPRASPFTSYSTGQPPWGCEPKAPDTSIQRDYPVRSITPKERTRHVQQSALTAHKLVSDPLSSDVFLYSGMNLGQDWLLEGGTYYRGNRAHVSDVLSTPQFCPLFRSRAN